MQPAPRITARDVKCAEVHILRLEGPQAKIRADQLNIKPGLVLRDKLVVDEVNVQSRRTHRIFKAHAFEAEAHPSLEDGGGDAAGTGRSHGDERRPPTLQMKGL